MAYQLQKVSAGGNRTRLPAEFISVCILTFIISVLVTAYFCRSMCHEMKMPGGWTMSMMWMRMPGQSWFMSAINFLAMWQAMMVAMMLPSALPMFIRTRRQWSTLCYMACGYFTIWFAAGVILYATGLAFATAAMESEPFSRTVPLLSGMLLIAAGLTQFTRWKMTHLFCCRSASGCAVSCLRKTGFKIGCKQGVACCACCAPALMIQLVFGMMNPVVMIVAGMLIAAEKLLPRPEITVRFVGIAAILAGVVTWIVYLYAS